MRYLIFAFHTYYPAGGWNDYAGVAESIDAAKQIIRTFDRSSYQIVDAETHEVVEWGEIRELREIAPC